MCLLLNFLKQPDCFHCRYIVSAVPLMLMPGLLCRICGSSMDTTVADGAFTQERSSTIGYFFSVFDKNVFVQNVQNYFNFETTTITSLHSSKLFHE